MKGPRLNPLFAADPDDEALGQEIDFPINNVAKFGNIVNASVIDMIKTSALLPDRMSSLNCDLQKLVLTSVSKQTWAKHSSAWKLYKDFCDCFGEKFSLPIDIKCARAFATWAITARKLKSSTVKSYLASLNFAHVLNGMLCPNLNSDPVTKLIIKGAENSFDLTISCKPDRLPMNVHLLEILRHRISDLTWSDLSKQIFWTVCTVCFFSSCRMGELLASHENGFDPATTLVWENVRISISNEVLIFIPYTKTTGFKGKIIDLFEIKGNKNCPVSAIRRLKRMIETEENYNPKKPVFSFKTGKNLTKSKLNKWLEIVLDDFVDFNHKITGHSFRAGIPSTLASYPSESTVHDIKQWGSWESNCFVNYTKQVREKRKALFFKIVHCLYEN